MRKRKIYYGWFDARTGAYRVSLLPPDAPVRPSLAFETLGEIMGFADKKRAEVVWIPLLTQAQMQDRVIR